MEIRDARRHPQVDVLPASGSQGTASGVAKVLISSLLPADSPRLNGEDGQHIRRLAEIDGPLPPILVHRSSMRVIDGMHRLAAAKLKGYREIEVIFFDGDHDETFYLAVQVNTQHGLPLSLADRKAAATRMIASSPEMSDRAIANWAGLAAKTVARIRSSAKEIPPSDRRMGRDGRRRPLDARDGRRRAAEFVVANPQASLRRIAQVAQVSVGTARNVRDRVLRGEDPVAQKGSNETTQRTDPGSVDWVPVKEETNSTALITQSLLSLRKDPSLRFSEAGRELLRWLHKNADGILNRAIDLDVIPAHQRDTVSNMAHQCAQEWIRFAREVRQLPASPEQSEKRRR